MSLGEEYCRGEIATSYQQVHGINMVFIYLFILYTLEKVEDIGLLLDRTFLCKLGKGESLKEPTRKVQILSEQQQPGTNPPSWEIETGLHSQIMCNPYSAISKHVLIENN